MPSRVLVHVCCGPCAITTVQALRDEGFEPTGVFHNPNIHPLREYLRRREALLETSARLDFPVVCLDAEYEPARFFRETAWRERDRCAPCYALRLARTLEMARQEGFAAFTTTLLYSKFQKHDLIARMAADMAGDGPVAFLYRDFREGWKRGVEQSRAWGIYRQPYCGCLYSENERYAGELRRAAGTEA